MLADNTYNDYFCNGIVTLFMLHFGLWFFPASLFTGKPFCFPREKRVFRPFAAFLSLKR